MLSKHSISPHAASIPTNPDGVSVQTRLDSTDSSASPGFSWGKAGTLTPNTWLQCESVPSNVAGRYVYVNNAVIKKVFIANENTGTYTFGIYWHDGNASNLTLLGTVTVNGATGSAFDVSWAVGTGKQLAIKVESGAPKNVVAGTELFGSN